MVTQEEIIRFILLSKNQRLHNDETLVLEEWRNASKDNEIQFRYLSELFEDNELVDLYQSIDIRKGQNRIFNRIAEHKILDKRFNNGQKWIAVAAIIPLMIFSFMLIKTNRQKNLQSFNDFKPGAPKAVLEVSKGEKILLSGENNEKVFNGNGEMLGIINDNTFICNKDKLLSNNELNTLRIPTGGEYKIILSDETKVFANSDSKIQYPYAFDKEKRTVKLSGEAYFEVTRNEKQPFEVITKNSTITVLGTKFNVCSYNDDNFEQVTLEEGMVSVKYRGQEYILTPGMQLDIDTKNKKAMLKNVETAQYVSWKDELFRFQDMELDQLTKKIQRWYEVDFVFKDETAKSAHFTGAFSRNTNFNDFITLIESTTDVKFALKGNKIQVSKK